jgi:hypothetical protein
MLDLYVIILTYNEEFHIYCCIGNIRPIATAIFEKRKLRCVT